MWYYVKDGKQQGPVSDEDFQHLVGSGSIRRDTLVWREGMPDWKVYAETGNDIDESPALPEAGSAKGVVCSVCGRTFSSEDVIRIRDALVCASCKPQFVQRLKESAVLPARMEYAGFWIRFVATFIDGIIVGVVSMFLQFVAAFLVAVIENEAASISIALLIYLIQILISAAYEIVLIGKYGATLGKMACQIRVVTAEGNNISYGRATGRFFAKMLSAMIFYIGYIMAAFDEEKRGLHDHICGTRAVKC